jgi:hypothetical protein
MLSRRQAAGLSRIAEEALALRLDGQQVAEFVYRDAKVLRPLVEMGQAVEATRVADVGDGVLRLGELLFCLGDAAGLDEPDEVGSGGLPEDVREVGGGQASMLGGFRQCQRWIAEFAFDIFPRAANLDAFQLDLQVADALGAFAKLTRKQFQQAHQAGDLVWGQIRSAFVGGAQVAFGNSEPREPLPQSPERRGRSWLAQELAAGDGGDVAAEDQDGNGDVPETRVAGIVPPCRMPPRANDAAGRTRCSGEVRRGRRVSIGTRD